MADKYFGRDFSEDSIEVGTDPASCRNDTGFRVERIDPSDELVMRRRRIAQNWDRTDLKGRQEVNIHLLRGTDSDQNPVTRNNLFFSQFEREIIDEPV